MQRHSRAISVLLAAMGIMVASSAHAQTLTWSGTGANANWDSVGNWSSPTLVPANNFNRRLEFAGTNLLSNTNTLTGGTATSIYFYAAAGGFSLNGNSLVLSGSVANASGTLQTIGLDMALVGSGSTIFRNMGAGSRLTVNGALSGTNGLSLIGGGTVTLNAANSYQGNTFIGGTTSLHLGNSQALGTTGTLVGGGAGWRLDNTSGSAMTITNPFNVSGGSGTFFGSNSLTINAPLIVTSQNRTITTLGSGTLILKTIDANIATLTLTKDGAGTMLITDAAQSGFRGGLTLGSGTLILGHQSAMGSGPLSLNGGTLLPTVDLSTGTATVFVGSNVVLSGSRNIDFPKVWQTGGTRTITNSLAGGTFTLPGTVTVGTAGGVFATLQLAGAGQSILSGTVQIAAGGAAGSSFTFSGLTGTATVSGAIQTGTFTTGDTTAGTIRITNPNFLAATTIVQVSGATLVPTVDLNLPNPVNFTATAAISGTNNVTLTGSYSQTVAGRVLNNNIDPSATLRLEGPVSLMSSGYNGFAGSGNMVISGTISGGNTSEFRMSGTGTTTLLAPNVNSGTTRMTGGGVLVIGHGQALGTGTFQTSDSAGTIQAGVDLTGANAVTTPFLINNNSVTTIGGTNSIEFRGGLLRFSTAGTITNSLGAGLGLVFSGTTALVDTATPSASRNLVIQGSGSTMFSGPITGSGTLTKQGSGVAVLAGPIQTPIQAAAGTLRITGTNTGGGAISLISGVTLEVSSTANLGSGTLVLGSGTVGVATTIALRADGGGTFDDDFTGLIGVGTLRFDLDRATQAGPTSGTFSWGTGATNLPFLNTSGTVLVTGSNAYDLRLRQGVVFQSNAAITNNSAGLLTLERGISGTSASLQTITLGGSGDILVSGSFVPIATANVFQVIKAGPNTLTVSGTTSTGPGGFRGFRVNEGTLKFTAPGSAGGDAPYRIVSGTMDLNGVSVVATATSNAVMSGASLGLGGGAAGTRSVLTTGTGVFAARDDIIYSGNVANDAGGLIGGLLNIVFSGNYNIDVYDSTATTEDLVIAADISGSVSARILKNQAGTLVFSGSNSFTGGVGITAGVLRLDSAAALPGGVGSLGTSNLYLNGGIVGLTAGSGDLTRGLGSGGNQLNMSGAGTGPGTQRGGGFAAYGSNRFVDIGGSGASVAWGQTNFLASTTNGPTPLYLSASDATGTIDFRNGLGLGTTGTWTRYVEVADGQAAVDGILSGVVSGNANQTFAKTGAGVLQMTATNTYSGSTSIQAGTVQISGSGRIASSAGIDVAAGARLAFNRGDSYGGSYSNPIMGAGNLDVAAGRLRLTALNTFTGSTAVMSGAILELDGRIDNSRLDVAAGGTLMGSGTILGLTTIAGIHAPGNSPGIQTLADLTYNTGATVQWELWGNTTTNSPLAYDQIDVTGNLTFSGSTAFELAFTGSASPTNYSQVAWSNSFWSTAQEWLVFNVAGTTTGDTNLTLINANWQDSTGASFQTVRPGASFSVERRGSDMYITYAVPEPGAVALAGIGLAAIAAARRRRRR